MAEDSDKRPIIVKKIKKGGHGHHGGAWKVAYADFVTAMMAFFLLLWLISSVDEAKLEGLAEYFTPTIGVRDSMGIGFEGGITVNEDGTKKSDRSPPGVIVGSTQQGVDQQEIKDSMIESNKDSKLFEQAEEALKQAFESDPNLRDLSENIMLEQTPEGLKIELMDSDKHPMFTPGSTQISEHGRRILTRMVPVIEMMPNYISISGHTDASKMASRGNAYTNWELSADRANSARRFLLRQGVQPQRPRKVVGFAATELLLPDDPNAAKNRRITVILLRGDYLDLDPSQMPATRELLSVPTPKVPDAPVEEEKPEEEKPLIVPDMVPTESDMMAPGQRTQTTPDMPDATINPDVKVPARDPQRPRADPSEFMDNTQ